MKQKNILLTLTAAAVLLSCRTPVSSVPAGTWNYDLLMNGVHVGDARITVKRTDAGYVTENELAVSFAGMENTTLHRVTETADFKPVSIEVENRTVKEGLKISLVTRARFEGQKAFVETNGRKTEVLIEKPFVLEGAWFMSELIKGGFKKGQTVKAEVYDPTVELEETIPVTMKVEGPAETDVAGKNEKLVHVQHTFRNFKNIHSYTDDKGIVRKMVMVMLNNKIVLEIK